MAFLRVCSVVRQWSIKHKTEGDFFINNLPTDIDFGFQPSGRRAKTRPCISNVGGHVGKIALHAAG
jgi:hypothetical protein